MEISNVYQGKILIVNLDSREAVEEDLDEEMVNNYIGGAAINTALFEKYQDSNPIIIGCGPLTATFAPASSLGVMSAVSPNSKRFSHVPLTWQFAVEMKLSGFDFIVITGNSRDPVDLWLRDEIADINDASNVWGKETNESLELLRDEYGDAMIQALLIGPAGEACLESAQISENCWGGNDKVGFGKLFGEKKLKGILARGLGSLEVGEGYFKKSVEIKNKIINGKIKGKRGLKDILTSLRGAGKKLMTCLEERTHREISCYANPYPWVNYVMIEGEPGEHKESELKEPGTYILDISGLLSLPIADTKGFEILRRCQRTGLDPTMFGHIAGTSGTKDCQDLLNLIDSILGGKNEQREIPSYNNIAPWPLEGLKEVSLIQAFGLFSNAIPPQPIIANYKDFDVGGGVGERAMWWIMRQGLAYTLGICPMLMLMCPELTIEETASLLKAATEDEDLEPDRLVNVVKNMIRQGLELEQSPRDIHPSLASDDLIKGVEEIEKWLDS